MFRRRLIPRPRLLRRSRILGAAVLGGLGFAAGRASKPDPVPSPDVAAKLKELTDLHATGALTDAEFAAAKAKLLAP
jgi:hypothetical protein